MIRVAMAAHLSEISGAGTALVQKALGLDPARFRTLLVLPGHGPLKDKALQAGVDVHVVANVEASLGAASAAGKLLMLSRRMGYVMRLAAFFRRRQVDVVWVNSTASVFAGIAARLAGKPVVWQVHEVVESPSRSVRLKLGLIERLSQAIVYDAYAGQQAFPAERVARRMVVRNYFDPAPYVEAVSRPETGPSLGAQEGELLVVSNGVFRRKAPDVFLQAAAIVARATDAPVKFALLGEPAPAEGEFYESLKRMAAQEPLAGRVRFAGLRRDIPEILKRADVFVSPSRNEAMPIILTEAMAAATPVVASDIGDCRLFLEDGRLGSVVAPCDAQALAEAVCALLSDPGRAQAMGRCAQARIQELYDARTFWRPLEELLNEVAARRG